MRSLRIFESTAGFSLTELMVVVSLIVIMSSVGYSGFSSWQKRERVRAVTYQLVSNLKEVRIRAIERRTQHTIAFTANQYTVFLDQDGSGELESGEAVIKQVRVDEQDPGIAMTLSVSSPLIYDIRGIPRNASGGLGPANIQFTNEDGFWCAIDLSNLGSVNVSCETDI